MIGGGGHCKSVIEAAGSTGREIKGILDLPEYLGSDCLGYKVIGNDSDIPKFVDECEFVVTLGFIKNPGPRIRLHHLIEKSSGKLATVIASTVNAGATIGKGTIINTAANIEHDAFIDDYSHISTGAMVNGDCKIGKSCFIGSGAVVANGVTTVDECTVGAGGVVTEEITESGTYVGIPVKKLLE